MSNTNVIVNDSNRTVDVYNYLTVENCVLTGDDVAKYWGREIPEYQTYGLDANKVYYVYRPIEEIKDSNFSNKPLLSRHIDFSAIDYKSKFIAGTVGATEVVEDELKGTVVFWDKKAIDQLDKGLKYLSCGYTYTPKVQAGMHNGQKYDVVMTDIIANHVAMVDNPRYKPAVVADGAFNVNYLIEGIKKMKFLKAFKKLVMDSETMSFDEGIETVKSIMANDELSKEEKDEAIEALKKKASEAKDNEEKKDDKKAEAKDNEEKKEAKDNEEKKEDDKKTTMDADTVEAIVAKRVAEELGKYNKQSVVFDNAIADYTKLCGKIDKTVFDSADAVYDRILANHNIKSENKTLEQKQAMVEIIPSRNKNIKTVFDNAIGETNSLVPEHFSTLFKGN